MKSLLLDRTAIDLVLDASGNIAVCTAPYSISQDVACAIRLFAGEMWYDTTKGVPYNASILGQWPPVSLVKAQIVKAALTVPGVVSATCILLSLDKRTFTGQCQFVDDTGITQTVSF